MKKITVFLGSTTKRATYQAVQEFVENLKSYAEIDCEYVFLNDYNLGNCKGCLLCFEKGEEYCSLKDDRDILLEKLNNSDGVIFATPNYSLQVSALMKTFLDRLAFVFHRPRFFGKTFTAIVAQGVYGGDSIVKYLENVAEFWGFSVAKGCCITVPQTAHDQEKNSQKIKKAAARFYKNLMRSTPPTPSFFRLMLFRFIRTSHKMLMDKKLQDSEKELGFFERDYRYYKEKGWLESDYYYDTSLGFIKKLAGRFFDFLQKLMAKHKNSEGSKSR